MITNEEIKAMEQNFNNLIAILSDVKEESRKWVHAAKEQKIDCKYFDYLKEIYNNANKFISGLANERI
jgi:hypothetical protein